ncbi:MAG: transposase [Clostridia bacterium]|nr:transposase [Clostridia bacterium]
MIIDRKVITMSRKARIKSIGGIYHVMLRGINRQQIFYDKEDYDHFAKVLQQVRQVSGMKLHAYCMMGNHIHLLVQETEEPIETIFKRIGSAFVYWYNLKYERVGHLFQDRYRSEPVDSDTYYLTVLRYILQNPVKAGICARPEDYPYSSAKDYLTGHTGITDTDFAISLAPQEELRTYLATDNDDVCLDLPEKTIRRMTDTEACRQIRAEFGTMQPSPGKAKERAQFNASIQRLLAAGISIRQLSRLSGLSKKVIESSK